jgi:cytoskeletal protein CcmA (bactofilin family)
MKKPNLKEIACPHCQATQMEPEGAISTNCRACGKYFKLGETRGPRTVRTPKANREVFCVKCGAPNLVASAALSTQCIRCSHYLELGDKVVNGVQTAKLYAYDDVIFAQGCFFKGMEATGRKLEVRGKVFSKLRATEEIVVVEGGELSGELHSLVVRIERGAKVKVQTLECARLLVSGEVEISGTLTATEIVLSDGATFSGRLNIPEANLKVEKGVGAQFDSITCNEITIDGNVKLVHSISAEKISVSSVGVLYSPTIGANRIDVSPGGSLQGRIVKFVPRSAPVNPPEEHPQAEAA